jgi:hypothetical protein
MAQSSLTVTPESPTPPTNLSSVGLWPPNPLNWNASVLGPPYTPANAPYFDDSIPLATPNSTSSAAANGATLNEPGGVNTTFAAAHALLADSAGATSVAPEGAGTETVVTATSPNPSAFGQLKSFSSGPAITVGALPTPNASHASSLSGASTATLTSVTGASNVSGVGATLLTATGTNFNRSSVMYVSGVAQTTNYVNATTLTCVAFKKATAGTLPVTVMTNGTQSASVNWTLT